MRVRYELQTLPIGEDAKPLNGRILEVLNILPERRQFRALVEMFVPEEGDSFFYEDSADLIAALDAAEAGATTGEEE